LTLDRSSKQILFVEGPMGGPDDYSEETKAEGRNAQGQGPIRFTTAKKTYCYGDLEFMHVPESLFGVVADLQYADAWYDRFGLTPAPGPIDVIFQDMKNLGETYYGNIYLNVTGISTGSQELRENLKASVAHELWHALCAHNQWQEKRFVGSEDAVCTAMESMVFPDVSTFIQENRWSRVYPALRNGLLSEGPREENSNPARRGYRLWPWTLYLGRIHGLVALRQWATASMPDDVIAKRFREFCYSIIADDLAVPDPIPVRLAGAKGAQMVYRRQQARTGWAEAERGPAKAADDTMACPDNDPTPSIPHGWSDFEPSCPLSFRVPLFEVPRLTPGVLVIRRERPEPTEEFVALRPVERAGSSRLTRVGPHLTTQDMVSMRSGVAVRGRWVTDGAYLPYVPVAVICTATTPETAPQAGNRLLSYRLNPPADIVFVKEPRKPAILSWSPPSTGCAASLADCIKGYQVFGKTRGGGQKLVAWLTLAGEPPPPNLVGVECTTIDPRQTTQELPEKLVASYAQLGILSIDKHLHYPDGRMVMSDMAWSPPACTIIVHPNPFEATAGQPFDFLAEADFTPPGSRYRWESRGQVRDDGGRTASVTFDTEGPSSVTVTQLDAAGKRLAAATAFGRVKPKKKEEPQPTTGIWRLVRRSVWPEATGPNDHHKLDIGATKADCRNMHLGENRIIYQCLHSWTALPTTLTPGKEIAITLTAQSVVWPGDEGGNRTSTFVNWGRVEDGVVSPMGTNELAAKECRITLPKEGEGGLSICIKGEGGWMHWSVTYVYEWVPAKP
jgi:hypothetical protein